MCAALVRIKNLLTETNLTTKELTARIINYENDFCGDFRNFKDKRFPAQGIYESKNKSFEINFASSKLSFCKTFHCTNSLLQVYHLDHCPNTFLNSRTTIALIVNKQRKKLSIDIVSSKKFVATSPPVCSNQLVPCF